MGKSVTIDETTKAKLGAVAEPVVLVDEAGQIVGYFSPYPTGDVSSYAPEFSEEELRRWESEPGGRSLREIMADLNSMP